MELKLNEAKDELIQIRVTKAEKEEIKKEAIVRGVTVTDLIKLALNDFCKE